MNNQSSFALTLLFIFLGMLSSCCDQCVGQEQRIGMTDPRLSWTPVQHLANDWSSAGAIEWRKAAILGLLSKTAYEDDIELMSFLAKGMGFEECRSFQANNSAAHALISEKVVVIAFRGTEFTSLSDWKTDAYTKFLGVQGVGRMHTGFHTAYQDVRKDVEKVINENKGKKIWLTGHSLGGAMAVVCGVQLKNAKIVAPQIITYGQPRVGDNQTARWIDRNFSKSYQRIVNDNDVVPTLPPTWYFQYADAGRYVLIGRPLAVGGAMGSQPNQDENKLLTTERPDVFASPVGPVRTAHEQDGPDKVYQSTRARLPLTRTDLEKLIQKETEARTKMERGSLYFPNDEELRLEAHRVPMATGGGKLNQPMTVGGLRDWFNVEYITDHMMAGYLKLIRSKRDN